MRHIAAGISGFAIIMAMGWYTGIDIFSRGEDQGNVALFSFLAGISFFMISKLLSDD